MFLVAGLAVAGLVGIAAAFYFSIRPGNAGNKRGSRVQPDRTSHTRPDRYQGNDSGANRGRSAGRAPATRNYRAADHGTGPNPAAGHRGPGRTRARRPEADDDRWTSEVEGHGDRWAPEPAAAGLHDDPVDATVSWQADAAVRSARGGSRPGGRRMAAEADTDADPQQDGTAKSKRRSGWLKRGDINEELWPAETFGGVSDEQFWDDMASDKPLATTARTAESGSRRRPAAVPVAGLGDTQVMGDRRGRGSGRRARGPAGRSTRRGRSRLRLGRSRTGPGRGRFRFRPDRSTRPGRSQRPQYTGPSRTRPRPSRTRPGPSRYQTGPQPTYASVGDRTETRRRSQEEDPLTSSAFSLRTSGPVDGRSYQASRRSRDMSREQYEAAASQDTQTFTLADTQAATGGYPGSAPPLRQSDSVPGGRSGSHGGARAGGSDRSDGYRGPASPYSGSADTSVSTPPYGQNYGGDGYGYGAPGGPAEDARRSASQAGPGGPGGRRRGESRNPADLSAGRLPAGQHVSAADVSAGQRVSRPLRSAGRRPPLSRV